MEGSRQGVFLAQQAVQQEMQGLEGQAGLVGRLRDGDLASAPKLVEIREGCGGSSAHELVVVIVGPTQLGGLPVSLRGGAIPETEGKWLNAIAEVVHVLAGQSEGHDALGDPPWQGSLPGQGNHFWHQQG
jgi:hypothetical protein